MKYSERTTRQRAWFVVMVVCIIVLFILGTINIVHASPAYEGYPSSTVANASQGTDKFKAGKLAHANSSLGWTKHQKHIILDKAMAKAKRKGGKWALLTRAQMWVNFTRHDTCGYRVNNSSPDTAYWTCGMKHAPPDDGDFNSHDVYVMLCGGVAGLGIKGALASSANGWSLAAIAAGGALCIWGNQL